MTNSKTPTAEEKFLEELGEKSKRFDEPDGNFRSYVWICDIEKLLPTYRKEVLEEAEEGVKEIQSHSSSSNGHVRMVQKHLFENILEILQSLK